MSAHESFGVSCARMCDNIAPSNPNPKLAQARDVMATVLMGFAVIDTGFKLYEAHADVLRAKEKEAQGVPAAEPTVAFKQAEKACNN